MDKIRKFKIAEMPSDKEFASMPFGRQIEHHRTIKEFKNTAKLIHISQKRQTYSKAIKEALALNEAKQYYCEFYCSAEMKDDSFEFWFKA